MSSHGGPEVLRLTEIPEPEPTAGHHRIEVLQAGVNYADLHVREGDYLAGVTLPYVPGNEVMGYSDGRRVVADPQALYFGAPLDDATLVPAGAARQGRITFAQWMGR